MTRLCAYNTQMRRITTSDLCELTGYSRDQMRGLLAELPRFACRYTEARVARVYSNSDVILMVLLCRLEAAYGLKRGVVSGLCEPIAAALTVPRKVSARACLVVRVQDTTCEYIDEPRLIEDGLVVSLGPIFMAIDSYLLPTPLIQRDMGLMGAFHKIPSAEPREGRKKSSMRKRLPHEHQGGRPNRG